MAAEFIHRFVPGTSRMTILPLHPADGDENELIPVCRAVAPGAAVLSPRLARDVNPAELAEWIAAAASLHGIDASAIYALGYSDGADLATTILLHYAGIIAGGVLLRPRLVSRPDPLPQLKGSPILISAGASDPAVPLAESEALGRLLSAAGAAVDFAVAESDHELTPEDFSMAKRWFAQL
ncbi:MAG TPA: hypothetical protein VFC21_03870 [Bryobacteraceae bacterium]|nr:hypothetical protein [Bryobacteraceae bacterium]